MDTNIKVQRNKLNTAYISTLFCHRKGILLFSLPILLLYYNSSSSIAVKCQSQLADLSENPRI
jgi:hypothetical protein